MRGRSGISTRRTCCGWRRIGPVQNQRQGSALAFQGMSEWCERLSGWQRGRSPCGDTPTANFLDFCSGVWHKVSDRVRPQRGGAKIGEAEHAIDEGSARGRAGLPTGGEGRGPSHRANPRCAGLTVGSC